MDIQYILEHVFLPPKLPQQRPDYVEGDAHIFQQTRAFIASFVAALPDEATREGWHSTLRMLETWNDVTVGGSLDGRKLSKRLVTMDVNDVIFLYIDKQNAAILLHKLKNNEISFEAFEASPPNDAVMQTKGRLVRYFPESCAIFPAKLLSDETFMAPFAKCITQLSKENIAEFLAKSSKAGSTMTETRDTTDPALITDFLSTVLLALGRRGEEAVLQKHIRDEILCLDAQSPWRRSSFWSALRVCLQRSLSLAFPEDHEHSQYKNAILWFMTNISSMALSAGVESHVLDILAKKIARRASKMPQVFDFVYNETTSTIHLIRLEFEKIQSRIRAEDRRPFPDLRDLRATKQVPSANTIPLNRVSRIIDQQCHERPRNSQCDRWHPFFSSLLYQGESQCNMRLLKCHLGGVSSWSIIGIYANSTSTFSTVAQELNNVRPYLQKVATRSLAVGEFQKSNLSRIPPAGVDPLGLPLLDASLTQDFRILALAHVETWVEQGLTTWLGYTKFEGAVAASALQRLMLTYAETSFQGYKGYPMEKSLAILTIFELWVALDRIALIAVPLLAEYSPEIPQVLLNCLLLPTLDQLRRLERIEKYLAARHAQCNPNNASIFGKIDPSSLGVVFFDQSMEHQDLRLQIEQEARAQRSRKQEEWVRKKEQFESLDDEYGAMEHLQEIRKDEDGLDEVVHVKEKCSACRAYGGLMRVVIEPHEWPLPENDVQAKTACFELCPPAAFTVWRDCTWALIQDYARETSTPAQNKPSQPFMELFGYHALRPWALKAHSTRTGAQHSLAQHLRSLSATDLQTNRVRLASSSKSFTQTHYSILRLYDRPGINEVCVPNALRFHLFDHASKIWPEDQRSPTQLKSHSTLRLERGQYKHLAFATPNTLHTPNEVMTRLAQCPAQIEPRAFVALGSLRSGDRLQLLNVLAELESPNLDLNAAPVRTLMLETLLEAGPSTQASSLRQSHSYFLRKGFLQRWLEALERLADKIRNNWKEQGSMELLIHLALRALSLGAAEEVPQAAIALLRTLRQAALKWIRALSERVFEGTKEDVLHSIRASVFRTATMSLMTYDVEERHRSLLLKDEDDVADFIEACIYAHDNLPKGTPPPEIFQFHLRGTKIRCSYQSKIQAMVTIRGHGLNMAVQRLWTGAIILSPWIPLKGQEAAWLWNRTSPSLNDRPLEIHFNTLSGELLVDGRQLGRLPPNYESSLSYRTLLGPRILRVVASTQPGMTYASAHLVERHELHFGMHSGKVIIRARVGQVTYELLRPDKFYADFPNHFARNYVHLMDLQNKNVHFRLIDTPWTSSWELSNPLGPIPVLRCNDKKQRLLEYSSDKCQALLEVLRPLEDEDRTHITVTDDGVVEAALPRYGLNFFLKHEGQVMSREFGAIVDTNQDADTFHGLKSKLVLCTTPPAGQMPERSILVPYGPVQLRKTAAHVSVSIGTEGQDNIRYFRYSLDYNLGKLRSAPDILSYLFKAYLHAVTTCLCPDRLLGCTGTEEALRNLTEEFVKSPVPIPANGDIFNVLYDLAGLTPARRWYPSDRRLMQRVQWSPDLPSQCQHDYFHPLVEQILTHGNQFAMLYPGHQICHNVRDCGDRFLLDRAATRPARQASDWQIFSMDKTNDVESESDADSEADTSMTSDEVDIAYIPRLGKRGPNSCAAAFEIAVLASQWPQSVSVDVDLEEILEGKRLRDMHSTFNPATFAELLDTSIKSWGPLWESLRHCRAATDKFKVLFQLSAIVFRGKLEPNLVKVLLAFATTGAFKDFEKTLENSYNLSLGSVFDDRQMDDPIKSRLIC